MEYKKENVIAFNSYNEHFILSNMYPCKLEYKGMLFYGVDHLFHYLLYYQHPDIQSKILKCSGVCANFKAKDISDKNKELLTSSPRQRHNLLKKCIELKYMQCPQFRDYLSNTGNKDVVEFAWWGDSEYGCKLVGDTFQGENITGKILMEIRNQHI